MDREAVDAEARDQIADLRRERAEWCREKLGDLRNWLPLPATAKETTVTDKVTLVRCSDHAAWLAERAKSIGSSDAAAVLGISPFATPLSVYVSKVHPEPEEESEPMTWGHALEEPIAKEFQRRMKLLVVAPPPFALYRRAGMEHLHASPDRFVESEKQRVLEIKSTRYRAADWDDGIPLHVQVQAQEQLLVLGLDVAYVAVLIGGQDYRQFEMAADRSFQEALLEKLAEFWQRVQNRDPPAPSGATDFETVKRMFKRAAKKSVMLPPAAVLTYETWEAAREARLLSEKHEKAEAAILMAALGDAEEGVLPDGRRVTWTNEERNYKATEARTVVSRVLRAKGPALKEAIGHGTERRSIESADADRGDGGSSGGSPSGGDGAGEVRDCAAPAEELRSSASGDLEGMPPADVR